MYKGRLREAIETIVKILPRPQSKGEPVAKAINSWLILKEHEDAKGIVLLNTVANYEGGVPYDSIRELRKPDMLILRAQVILGQNGELFIEPMIDTASDYSKLAATDLFPMRLASAEMALTQCTPGEIRTMRELLIRKRMTKAEIEGFCESSGIPDGHKFFGRVSGRTPFLERDNNNTPAYAIWIKPIFVPILENLLLKLAGNEGVTLPPLPHQGPLILKCE